MKLLWLTNMAPGKVKDRLTGTTGNHGAWLDHVLEDLRARDVRIHILCPGSGARGALDENCTFATFHAGVSHRYFPEQEPFFGQELNAFTPDVIHVWGTEYGHTLAMMKTAEALGYLDHTVVSIQGLCGVYAPHYAEGVPHSVRCAYSFRDLIRRDNILRQQKKFALRGDMEAQALGKALHVIGRTDWDRACTHQLAPKAAYHFCNETLRQNFYQAQWDYDTCRKHRIFASSCSYPVKGFHYLLEAMPLILRDYPDATLTVTGSINMEADKIRQSRYQQYLTGLIRKHGLEDKVEFLGNLGAEQMKDAFLEANVFALPSTIENSPNSLGEAMLLGMPCVASDVGGVTTMMTHAEEGYVYQSTAPYMLAHYIREVFDQGEKAAELGQAARRHALKTHDPDKNLRDLLRIYQDLM